MPGDRLWPLLAPYASSWAPGNAPGRLWDTGPRLSGRPLRPGRCARARGGRHPPCRPGRRGGRRARRGGGGGPSCTAGSGRHVGRPRLRLRVAGPHRRPCAPPGRLASSAGVIPQVLLPGPEPVVDGAAGPGARTGTVGGQPERVLDGRIVGGHGQVAGVAPARRPRPPQQPPVDAPDVARLAARRSRPPARAARPGPPTRRGPGCAARAGACRGGRRCAPACRPPDARQTEGPRRSVEHGNDHELDAQVRAEPDARPAG